MCLVILINRKVTTQARSGINRGDTRILTKHAMENKENWQES
jgi:hypothetical protein